MNSNERATLVDEVIKPSCSSYRQSIEFSRNLCKAYWEAMNNGYGDICGDTAYVMTIRRVGEITREMKILLRQAEIISKTINADKRDVCIMDFLVSQIDFHRKWRRWEERVGRLAETLDSAQ